MKALILTWPRRIVTASGIGVLWGLLGMWMLGPSVFSISLFIVTSIVLGVSLGRFYLYFDGSVARFWPMQVRRHCYDKPHRCPGWAGGGRRFASEEQATCSNGAFPAGMYKRRLWKWRFHRCSECGTVALPIVIKYLDPFWWVLWKAPMWRQDFSWWREDRKGAQ